MWRIIGLAVLLCCTVACESEVGCLIDPNVEYLISYRGARSNTAQQSTITEFFPHDCSPEQIAVSCEEGGVTRWDCLHEDGLHWRADWAVEHQHGGEIHATVETTDPLGVMETILLTLETSRGH